MEVKIKELLTMGFPYLAVVSACYLFGYWGAFNLNILEFVGFADIAKLAIYPLIASIGFFLVGVLMAEIKQSAQLPPGGGANTSVGKFGIRHWRTLVSIGIALTVLIAIFGEEPWKWFMVAILISLLSTPLTHVDFMVRFIPDPRLRSSLLFMLLLLPALSFAYGRTQAYEVRTFGAEKIVDIRRSQIELESDQKHPVSYLGFLNGIYVLYEAKTDNIVLLHQRNDLMLMLMPKKIYPSQKPGSNEYIEDLKQKLKQWGWT